MLFIKQKRQRNYQYFFGNLRESLPDNSIINESMTMYDEDIDLDMKMELWQVLQKVELRLIFSNR